MVYDNDTVTLTHLLDEFYNVIDPTQLNYQGVDHGTQYRNGVYYVDEVDLPVIKGFIESQKKNYKEPIVTEVLRLMNFYDAEDYHQMYFKKNGLGNDCHVPKNRTA